MTQAVATLNKNDPALKLPAGTGDTATKLREAYAKILNQALGTTPPPSLADVKALVTKELAAFKTGMGNLAKGLPVQIPNTDPPAPTTADQGDAAARKALFDQVRGDINNITEFTTFGGDTMDINAIDPVALQRLQADELASVKAIEDHQPPYSMDELKTQLAGREKHFQISVAYEKFSSDAFLQQLLAQGEKNRQKMIEAMKE